MKKGINIVSILLFGFVFSQQMELNTNVVDMGQVAKGKKADSELLIKNVGKAPLIITSVKPSCGCTVPEWPKEPIMPGKNATIKISYSDDKVGEFNKVIEVYSNDVSASRKVIRIKGNVK